MCLRPSQTQTSSFSGVSPFLSLVLDHGWRGGERRQCFPHVNLFVAVHHNINIGRHTLSFGAARPVIRPRIYADTVDGGVAFSPLVKPTKKRRRTI